MTESDARSTIFDSGKIVAPADAAHAAKVRKSLLLYVHGEPETPKQELEVWPGKDWELAAKIEHDLTGTHGRVPTSLELTEAYKQACLRYQKKNNRGSFTVKNLRDGLKQHKAEPLPSPRRPA